jgi:anti-sigma factor RsiW
VRGTSGTLFTDDTGNRTLLTWQEGEVSIWIGGDLTAEQVQALADSLQ